MKASQALIAYTPSTWSVGSTVGQVKIGPLLGEDDADWTAPYAYTGGAAFTATRDLPEWQQIAMLFIEFHTIVVRDGIDPQVAHAAFLAIDEYRERIAPDVPGADA